MKRKVLIKQHDITDCGAACLASVAAYFNHHLPISRIRQYASTDKKGTNVLGMIEAAAKLGFTAKGVKGPFDSLFKIPKPAIAHVIVKEQLHHFVVIYDTTPTHIVIMDPADGQQHKLSHEEFRKQWTGVLIILLPSENFVKSNQKTSVIARFWSLIHPHKSIMLQALTGAVIYTLIGLSTSIYVQKIVDHVLVEGNKNLVNLMSVLMIFLILFQLFISQFKSVFVLKTGQKIDTQLILGYYKHLLNLPQQFFDNMRVGEIISRINDAVKIRIFINDVALNIAINLFIVVFSFALMFTYYWKMALIMLAIIPLYSIIYITANKLNKKTQRDMMENAADLESQLVESLNAIATVKRFGLEEYCNLKTETKFIKLLKNIYRSSINSIFSSNSSEFISHIFTIILLWKGSYFVIDNQLTPGELLSFYALTGYLTGPAAGLISMNKTIQDALIAADRLFEIMDLDREETENKIALTADMIDDIHFKNVAFRYGSKTSVFTDLNLHIPKGKITAVVGESGSGKTTLMSLLQNIYPISAGNILIGSYDIRYIDHQSLRKAISVVPQKIDLFAGNVIDNIALGEIEPDMKKILTITTELGILEFIENLPNGFLTYLGENGTSLSGGQKQRIAIARALYNEPEILILDEATSSLDSGSEQFVKRAIQNLREKQKTILIIAHRLSTIMKADKIIVLENGKVVEEGSHQELLSSQLTYSNLWKQQYVVNGIEELHNR